LGDEVSGDFPEPLLRHWRQHVKICHDHFSPPALKFFIDNRAHFRWPTAK